VPPPALMLQRRRARLASRKGNQEHSVEPGERSASAAMRE
jgi:hypothetical protein